MIKKNQMENNGFTDKQIDLLARKIAERLVKFGFDIDEPIEMQKDFAYLRRQRRAAETVGPTIRKSFLWFGVSAVIGGAFWFLWEALKSVIRHTSS